MAVREILLQFTEDEFGGPVPTSGRFTAVASATRLAGPEVTIPNLLTMDIVAGQFAGPVLLETNDAPYTWYWTVAVRDDEDTVMWKCQVIVPTGVTPIGLGDLPQINPYTVEVGQEPEAAWWIELEQRPIIVRLTQEEYDALTAEQKNDPHILYVIPAII